MIACCRHYIEILYIRFCVSRLFIGIMFECFGLRVDQGFEFVSVRIEQVYVRFFNF